MIENTGKSEATKIAEEKAMNDAEKADELVSDEEIEQALTREMEKEKAQNKNDSSHNLRPSRRLE